MLKTIYPLKLCFAGGYITTGTLYVKKTFLNRAFSIEKKKRPERENFKILHI